LPQAVQKRFGGVADTISLGFPGSGGGLDDELADVLTQVQAIDAAYRGQPAAYSPERQ
jgi:hypothetical protein